MVSCSILGCKSRSERKEENITFHSYPDDVTLRFIWLRATDRLDWQPTRYTRVCSRHFENVCFRITNARTKLRKGSVPKLFLPTLQARSSWCSPFDDEEHEKIVLKKKKSSKASATATSASGAPGEDLQTDHLENHVGFSCNSCFGAILGFRYSCVECVNFDLCTRCEAMREHDHHYVLRVPQPRPEAEFKAMMAEVRAALAGRPQMSQYEVEVKYEPQSDDEDLKPVDPLTVDQLAQLAADTSSASAMTLSAPAMTSSAPRLLLAPSVVDQPAPGVVAPGASNIMISQPMMVLSPLVITQDEPMPKPISQHKPPTRAQTVQKPRSGKKVTAGKRKTSKQGDEPESLPIPFKMPKPEPQESDTGDTGDPSAGPSSAEQGGNYEVFTMQYKGDGDSGVS